MSWEAAAILGAGALGAFGQSSANSDNVRYQKAFAQRGIRWRVADAKKAGVHPLFALGANPASFTPSVASPDYSFIGDAANAYSKGRAAKKAEALALDEFNLRQQKTNAEIGLINSQADYYKSKALPGAGLDMGGEANNGKDGPAVPRIRAGGVPIEFDPNTSDASRAEDRWGDFAGGIYGFGVALMDLVHNGNIAYNKAVEEISKRFNMAKGEAENFLRSLETESKRRRDFRGAK